MIKKLILGFLILGIIAVGAVYFFGASLLNSGVKKGVETVGPKVTQTSVVLNSVDLSPLSGNGVLKGLYVGNPEGFKSEHIFALEQIDIKVDTGSVFSDKIIIDQIVINKPEISYEKTLTNSNVQQLLKNIEAFTGPMEKSKPADKTDTGAKKQVVIRKLIIEDATVHIGALGVGQTVTLPRIEMNDIGEGGEQISVAEAIKMVLNQVLTNIGPAIANAGELTKEAANVIKTQGLEKIDQAKEGATKAADEAVNQAKEGLKSLLGN